MPELSGLSHPGLTSAEAARRLAQVGRNAIGEPRWTSWVRDLLHLLGDPMGLMLGALALIYWAMGERTEAWVLLGALVPILGVDAALGIRSQRALKALKATLQPIAHVIRDGRVREIAIQEIVPEDLLVLEEGQSLPADGRLLEAQNLTLNEAPLTGESVPVEKQAGDGFLSGTTVLSGRGLGRVEKTGAQSQIGSLAQVLNSFEATKSPLQIKIHRLVRTAFLAAIGLAGVLFAVEYARSQDLGHSAILALTLAMAAIPEEFPLVFTLYLSLAAWRLSRRGVLVKSLPAVEALGGVDVICTDKTGTLTEGLFQLAAFHPSGTLDKAEEIDETLVQSCEPTPTDALEKSILTWVQSRNAGAERLSESWTLTHDYPFETQGKHMSHVWSHADGRQRIAMKGSVEGVLEHCALTEENRRAILARTEEEARLGRRVLGVAAREGAFTGRREEDETALEFRGLMVFTDPVRPQVRSAIADCRQAGIQIKMLTGDHLLTAHAIAEEIGLEHDHDWLSTGDQLHALPPDRRAETFARGTLFARLRPEQKMELVETLRARGLRVAMTGDGINDAAALKLADVGISMGRNATDVARSTARLILMQNDFRGITDAVFEGRRVMAALRASFGYLIAFHTPIILLTLVPPLLGLPALLRPIHIILMELIVHPVSAVVFDDPQSGKTKAAALVDRRSFFWSLGRGTLLTASVYALFYFRGHTPAAQGLAVVGLVFGNIGLLAAEKIQAGGSAGGPRTRWAVAALLTMGLTLTRTALGSRWFQISFQDAGALALALTVAVLPPLLAVPWNHRGAS